MSSARDFLQSSLGDSLVPLLRQPIEDILYETLDKRAVPNRNDWKELRDGLNSLRGQLAGATGGVKRLADAVEGVEDRISDLEAAEPRGPRVVALEGQVRSLAEQLSRVEALLIAMVERPIPEALPEPPVEPAAEPVAETQTEGERCAAPGCTELPRARGFCPKHYQKWRRGKLGAEG